MFGWFNTLFTNLGKHDGVQNTKPMGTCIEGVKSPRVDNSLQIGTIWQCVDLIARTFASLRIDVIKEDRDGRQIEDKSCNLYNLLAKRPNSWMTPYDFWHYMSCSRIMRGNAYARLYRNGRNEVIAMVPLPSDQMVVEAENNNVIYYYTEDGKITKFSSDDILHWRGLGNCFAGLSLLEYMQSTITESNSAQTNAISIFANKGKVNGILTADGILNNLQKSEITKQFQNMRENNQIPVLPASLRFQQLSLSPADTQLLETRKYTSSEICRWLGVPESMLTGEASNISEVERHFYRTTILPLCTSAEELCSMKIPCTSEKGHRVKFRLSELNRASDSERASLNATYVQNGIKSRNEIRREEGLRDVAGGDILTAQVNLSSLENLKYNYNNGGASGDVPEQPIKQ